MPAKRRNDDQSNQVAFKRTKADERIAAVVAEVARGSPPCLSFSNINSPITSEPSTPTLPDDVITVPEVQNGISIGRHGQNGQDWIVPQRENSTANGQNADQGARVILDEMIQESVIEVGNSQEVGNGREVTLNPGSAPSIATSPIPDEAPQSPQEMVSNPSPAHAPLVHPASRAEDEEDPWIAALDDRTLNSTRSGIVTVTHDIPRTEQEIKLMEELKLPEDVSAIDYPRIGTVQILKLVDETAKIYDGLDLMDGRFVAVRQLDRAKHMRRLRLACRLSLLLGDTEEYKRIYELLIPAKTTFELMKEKNADGESKLNYYWIEPPNHGSLHAYVIERKRLPEIQSKEYFRQICQIVEFCHSRGVIIRDLKLRKFVFADPRRQTIKLDDLDETAICPENKSDPDLIDYDNFDVDDDRLCDRHGCPAYVSPEILDLSKKWYSGRASDVWSLGVLLYVLLVGRYPFYDVTPAGLFSKIRQGRIHLSEQDGVRLEARLLIRNMLRRDPRERPSVIEVLAHPWLQPKDYRASFKVFDSSECIFWKSPNERLTPGGNGSSMGASTSGQQMVNSLQRTGGNQQIPSRVPQRQVSAAAKIVERINANINGSRQGGGY